MIAQLGDRFAEVDVVTDPFEVAASLQGDIDLLVVNACWFAMTDARYNDSQRAEFAVPRNEHLEASIARQLDAGTPLLALHTAVLCFDGWSPWVDALGAAWDWSTSFHPPPSELTIQPEPGTTLLSEPIVVLDEEYQGLQMSARVELVAHSASGHPLVWTVSSGAGRVAVDLLGHGSTSLDNPGHRLLIDNLIDWLCEFGGGAQ